MYREFNERKTNQTGQLISNYIALLGIVYDLKALSPLIN